MKSLCSLKFALILGIATAISGCSGDGDLINVTIVTKDRNGDVVNSVALASIDFRSSFDATASGGGGENLAESSLKTVSDTTGMAELKLPTGYLMLTFFKPGSMLTRVFLSADETMDLTSSAVVVFPGNVFDDANYCTDALNVDGGGWLRVYKMAGNFTTSDRLFINNLDTGSGIDSGDDLIVDTVADGTLNYIDIFEDSASAASSIGHRNKEISAGTYQVILNDNIQGVIVSPCSLGGITVVYMK